MNAEALIEALRADGGYPTEEGLAALRAFRGSPRELVEVLEEAVGGMGGVVVQDSEDLFRHRQRIKVVQLITGGWSGCERMFHALDYRPDGWASFFWFRYWESTHRGGLYVFHVPLDKWDEPMPEWPPSPPPAPEEEK